MSPSCTELWQRNRRDLSATRDRAAEAQLLLVGECSEENCTTKELKERRRRIREKLERALGRIDTLTVQCREIDVLSSTHNQVECYGEEQWNMSFIRFKDIEDAAERQQLWRLLGRSRFVRFQQIFCDRGDRIIPRYEKHHLTYHFPGQPSCIDGLPLEACLVNPDRISDELVHKLNIIAIEKGEPALDRLRKKKLAIPRLKTIFQNASRLAKGNERFLIIHDDDSHIDGQLIYLREKPHSPVDKEARVYEDVYSAYRKTDHQREGYGEETDVIGSIITRVRTFNERMNERWRKETSEDEKAALVSEASELHATCMAHLDRVINQHKVRARDLLDQMKNLTFPRRDGAQIRNPSAAMAKMVAIMNALEKRFMEMRGKGRANEDDHMLLGRVIADHEETIRGIQKRLTGIRQYWQRRQNIRWQTDDMMANIERCLWPRVFKDLTVQPFRGIRQNLQEKYAKIPDILSAQDRHAFLDHLTTMQDTVETFYNEHHAADPNTGDSATAQRTGA